MSRPDYTKDLKHTLIETKSLIGFISGFLAGTSVMLYPIRFKRDGIHLPDNHTNPIKPHRFLIGTLVGGTVAGITTLALRRLFPPKEEEVYQPRCKEWFPDYEKKEIPDTDHTLPGWEERIRNESEITAVKDSTNHPYR